jgi:hypothetical protein
MIQRAAPAGWAGRRGVPARRAPQIRRMGLEGHMGREKGKIDIQRSGTIGRLQHSIVGGRTLLVSIHTAAFAHVTHHRGSYH